jgi:DNA-binding NarL/FixJ family response regulator
LMLTILDISLDTYVKEQLQAAHQSGDADVEFHHSETTQEALDHISDHDIDVILVDVRVLPKLRKEINELLANTPLTTKIILLESPDEVVNLEPFAHLGLKSIPLPLSPAELQEAIA